MNKLLRQQYPISGTSAVEVTKDELKEIVEYYLTKESSSRKYVETKIYPEQDWYNFCGHYFNRACKYYNLERGVEIFTCTKYKIV